METATARARVLFRLRVLFVTGLLLTSLALGFSAAGGNVDPNLHAMVAVVAAALAVASHIRQGGGWDFLAVVSLVGAAWLGLMVQGGGAANTLHLAVALPAVVLSTGLHVRRW